MTLVTAPNAGIPASRRADDMAEQEWEALEQGLAKFLEEEREEDEHAEDDDPSLTKEEAGYVFPAPGPDFCEGCTMFQPPDACSLVKGEPDGIQARGTCQHYKSRGAADSALDRGNSFVIALDETSANLQYDKDGRLHVREANICKECISPYRGKEIPNAKELGLEPDRIYQLYRPADEIEKGAATSNGIQILRIHKAVSADDHQPWDVVGAVGTQARFERPYLKNALTIWPSKDIDGVEKKTKYQLSPGYHYTAVMEPGVFEGKPFDGRMAALAFNHMAIVEEGRQGPEIVIGDSLEPLQWAAIAEALGG